MNEPPSRTSGHPIAIIAMGAMFPGRGTTHGFFRDLIEGVDTISEVPDTIGGSTITTMRIQPHRTRPMAAAGDSCLPRPSTRRALASHQRRFRRQIRCSF